MSNENQLIPYTGASARKAGITGESRVWFTRNRLDEDFSHVIERGLLRPLVRKQREKHRTFTWNFDKLCIAILKIEEKAKVQRTTHTVSSTPTASSGGTAAAALGQAVEHAGRPVGTAISHIQKVTNLRSTGFGANGIVKGSSAAIEQSRIGLVAKGSEFCAKQSLGMKNLAKTTYEAVGSAGTLSLGIAAAYAGYAFYRYVTEAAAQPQVPVTEYIWDYSQITQEDLDTLAGDLVEDD
ncbi:hypothetical protein C8R45DRAFT_87306 [Mycena sanguinolenta]|nr:hypothetical protein C8R45DRAFT_87306 [Mycena sanguinolenta]